MTGREVAGFTLVLLLLGAGWGLTIPLSKIAVSTGYRHFGLIFWDVVIGAACLGGLLLLQRRALPMTRDALEIYAIIALVGTLVPNSASYQAIAHLPAGVMAIVLSLVPMLAFPIAMLLGMERFGWRRLLGLSAGLGGVLLLVLPEASLPERAMLVWVPLALVAPLCYAFEGNFVARWGTRGLDAVQVLLGASLLTALVSLPLALATGQFISPLRPFGAPEWALIVAAIMHAVTYAGYVWLVSRAGAVFSAQVSYLVTGFGVLASLLLLREAYSPFIWAALTLVLMGVFLVQPRLQETLAPDTPIRDTPR